MVRNAIIIGSGPAGYTAAIYTARANLEPLLFEGYQPGGQLMITTDVENYPGYPKGIMGPEMMDLFREQAERFGTQIVTDNVTKVDFSKRPYKVWVNDVEYQGEAVIVATGATAKWLNIPAEQRLQGYGLSSCATCDGFFFREKEVIVVGGGDTAMEEANFLTRFASRVTVIHRRDHLRASKIMQDRAFKNPKIEFLWNSAIVDIDDVEAKKVTTAHVKNLETQEVVKRPVDGIFIAIGHQPNSQLFVGQLEMDELGYIITKPDSTYTNIPGVFAVGDVTDRVYRQAVTAAGSGCMGAIDLERFLEAEGH